MPHTHVLKGLFNECVLVGLTAGGIVEQMCVLAEWPRVVCTDVREPFLVEVICVGVAAGIAEQIITTFLLNDIFVK